MYLNAFININVIKNYYKIYDDKAIISCKMKRKKMVEICPQTRKLVICGPECHVR